MSMAALRLGVPSSRSVPAAVGMMSCCPQHLPLLISEVQVAFSVPVPPHSSDPTHLKDKQEMPTPPCAASQDAEMPARTWAPLCLEWGPRGMAGQAWGQENRLLPAACFVMPNLDLACEARTAMTSPKCHQETLTGWEV